MDGGCTHCHGHAYWVVVDSRGSEKLACQSHLPNVAREMSDADPDPTVLRLFRPSHSG